MIITMPFIIIPLLISDRLGNISFFFVRLWVRIFSIATFVFFKRHGTELIEKGKPYIFTISHTSFLDAPAIPVSIPVQMRGLGKKELSKIPLFGLVTGRFAVWVDRTNQESRKKSIEKMMATLDKGISIMVAPEGTRNDSSDPLLPFYNGPFRLAIETGVPVMPVVIYNAKRLMPKGKISLKPGTVHTYLLPPVVTENLTEDDLPVLKEKVFQMMKKKIESLDKLE
jgi:1-acyl-sn-glycerol-3-phosphate acyltransferase